MDERRFITRVPVFTITVAALILAAVLGIYFQQSAIGGDSTNKSISVDLMDHSGNPNDGKDNCPHDGNAGGGNDNKGPNGGCRPPKGQYGKTNP